MTTTCTHCGSEVPLNKSMCPNCGTPIGTGTSSGTNAQWPPAPTTNIMPSTPDLGRLITGKRWGDLWLGFIASWALLIISIIALNSDFETAVLMIAIILPFLIYFGVRRAVPTFARGFGFGLLSMVVLVLGAFAICMVGQSRWYR